jgi:translation initiation factor IF-2
MVKASKEKEVKKKPAAKQKTKKALPKAVKAQKVLKPKATAVKKPRKEKVITPKLKPLKIKTTAILKEAVAEKPVIAVEVPKPVVLPVKPAAKQEAVKAKPAEVIKPKPAPVKKEEPVTKPVIKEKKVELKPAPVVVEELKEIELVLPITVKDLAVRLQEKPSSIIKTLMDMKVMAVINQNLEEEIVRKLCEKYRCRIKRALDKDELALLPHKTPDEKKDLQPRAPIVTFMGHVDHGKTSLLDAIRKTKVAESEHGGITQHIGAYRVNLPNGEITFLDTPGHEAFTAMRARGAKATDIVVLVVAADDGVMPQTEEAIDHARAAGVPIIVALNKMDKPQINIDRVKKQLSERDLAAEDWGGKTITVPVSAKIGQGIDNLLEMILLESQMLELKANPRRLARGVVLEAKMTKGKGPVATLLVQNGTLHLNENIIVGNFYGKIRAMFNDRGASVTEARPAVPVEVLGISGIPQAGEQFFAIKDEKEAKELANLRQEKERQLAIKTIKRISLEELHSQIKEGKLKELKLIIKADVQGSIGAIKETLSKLNVSEIKLDIIHAGVGNINSSDVVLAVASDALILGFNVTADELAKELVAKEGIDVRTYNIIYELANDIKLAVEGMLEPKIKKVFLGRVEVRKVFKLSRSGTIAGCFVTKGKINRTSLVNLIRNGEAVFEGKLSSLKRFKDDVREVLEGFECGIALAGFDAYQEGDVIEAYEIEKIARKL